MWYNKKLTVFQQELDKLRKRVDAGMDLIDKQLADNRRDLLEFADLSNKTRRLYLRLTRLTKIEQKETMEEIPATAPVTESARDVREGIDRIQGI